MEFIRILWGYWWLRGIAAALGLLLFVREFFGYSIFETTAAILALLNSWQDALSWIGRLIGRLPFIPPLTPDQALYLSLILTFSVPAGARAARDLGILLDASKRQFQLSKIRGELSSLEGRNGVRAAAQRRSLRRDERQLEDESTFVEVSLSLLLFLAAGASTGVLIALTIGSDLQFGNITTLIILAAVIVAFALACRLRGYLVGAVTLFGFLLTLQAAYILDAPWVREYVREQTDAISASD